MSIYSNRVLEDSPVLYFHNDANGVNNIGSRTPAITTGGSTTFPTTGGITNTPYMYNSNSAVNNSGYGFEYSDSTATFDDRVFTISGWINIPYLGMAQAYSATPVHILNFGTTQYGIWLESFSNSIRVIGSFGGTPVVGSIGSLSNSTDFDKWVYVAITMDSSNLKLYINGSLADTETSPGSLSVDSLVKYWTRYRSGGWGTILGAPGKFDEWAVFNTTLSSTTIAEHYEAGFGVEVIAEPATASALAVDSAISTQIIILETPATATADIGDIQVSNFNTPTMLDGYLAGRSFEQWFKFDEIGKIKNYGSGGNAELAWAFNGESKNVPEAGIQGSGALKLQGQIGNTVTLAFGVNEPYTPEITDNEFSIGFWFKGEEGFQDKNTVLVALNNPFGDDSYNIRMNDVGFATFTCSNGTNTYVATANAFSVLDNNWHLIQVRASDTNNQIAISVDNGTEITTSITGNHFPQNIGFMQFAQTSEEDTGTNIKYGYISNMWITGYSSIGSTERAAMITAAAVPIQGAAKMLPPVVRFENQYHDLLSTYSPKIAFRLNEASGAPINFGSGGTLSVGKNGSNITYLQPTQNTYAYKFTNADTFIQGDYTYASGTFSSGNHQTMSAVFKAESTVNFEQLIGSMGMYGFLGAGITLSIGATNGYLEARINQGFGETDTDFLTTTINVCDNKYHHAVGVRDGSSFKLYLDGKQVATMSNAATTLSDNATYAISGEGKFNFGQEPAAKALHIDEFAVLSSALSATQVFELYQSLSNATEWTASALAVDPAVSVGFGVILSEPAMTASAELPNVFPFINPITANAMLQQPNFEAIDNINIAHTVWEASAQGEDPGWDIGENNQVLHMDASAMMPEAEVFVPGNFNSNPGIATAEMVEPAFSSTRGALIKPQSLNANAFFALPPAYYLVFDDLWYSSLLNVDYQSEEYEGKITFFNTSNDIYLSGGYDGWNAFNNRSPLRANYGYNLYDSPLPVASAGYYDLANRKALNIRNIALVYDDNNTYSEGWTMETMIQTTKKNQFIAAGRYLGDTSSSVSRSKRTGIRLKDGKIAITEVKDSTLGFFKSNDPLAITGFKDIADGEWHHIIVQYRDEDGRTQIWIDGKLDIQRYGARVYYPGQIGYNSNDVDVYSDFNISAISVNKESFVLERETYLNYLAAIGVRPIYVEPATASVEIGEGTRGKGNRARALMLYFWPTFNAQAGYYVGQWNDRFAPVGINTTSGRDVGAEPFDYDTFYGLSTYLTDDVQKFFDWDVFPLPIKNFYSGDTYRGDKHPLLNDSVLIDRGGQGTTYVDPITDNYRYLNLMEDVYEIDQYDAIFFRNYPDQSREQDSLGLNSKAEVDEYFNLQEKTLFAEFLDNLREAIDTYGISLFVTNPQLAKDLGIIANAADVPLLRNQGSFLPDEYSDNRAPVVTGRAAVDGTPTDDVNIYGAGWIDTWFNDRHRLINELEYLTDDNTFIWTDYAFYQNADELEYGGPDRLYKRYENRPYGLQIDDEFVFADSGNPRLRLPYQAVKPEDVLAGIPITALSKKIWNQNNDSYVQVDNPYKDYVTTIALPPGTNLNGKLTNSKIFVSFSENVSNSHTGASPQYNTNFVEYHQYDIASNYWVDIAYNGKIIDEATRAQYKAGTAQQPPLYDDNDPIKQYWSLSGDNIISRIEPITQSLKGFVGGDIPTLLQNPLRTRTRSGLNSLNAGERLRDALGRFASGGGSSSVTGGNLQTFKIVTGRTYDTGTVFIPSINTRALWWLSDKVRLTGKVVGSPAMTSTVSMPDPLVEADHPNTFIAGAMIATATIAETSVKGPDINVLALPMYASAEINGTGGKRVLAGTGANATAGIVPAFAITQGAEQVIVYLHHVDPILYLRKEIIR